MESNSSSIRTQRVFLLVWLFISVVVFTACGGGNENTADIEPTITNPSATVTPLSIEQTTPVPTDEVTPAVSANMVLWWPEALAPSDLPRATELLGQQIADFAISVDGGVDVEFRRKSYQDTGGILSTLRTAGTVAPGVLPDLTLIRRSDLASAVQDGVIHPLEGFVSSAIIGDLYDSALELGQVDGQIYGLPYTLDVLHLSYQSDETVPEWSFAAVLDSESAFVFPAGRVNGINNTFYLQYLDAGGTAPRSDGSMRLNEDALRTVLDFYEQAYTLGIVDGRVFEYASATDYKAALLTAEINMAVLDSTTYMDLIAEGVDLLSASIPTESGQAVSVVDGWMWVMTTDNTDRQELAASFLNRMMDTSSQREYAEAVHMLPSQRMALLDMAPDLVDVELMDSLLDNAVIPLPENAGGSVARAMQNALIAVLSGESTAEEAVQVVIEQVGD
jgi:ABC-type glycerol-3-phosphate transport system substrate-binding protein